MTHEDFDCLILALAVVGATLGGIGVYMIDLGYKMRREKDRQPPR